MNLLFSHLGCPLGCLVSFMAVAVSENARKFATLFVMWPQTPLLAGGPGELCVQHTQPPLFKHLHLPPQQAVCVGKAITLPSSHAAQKFKRNWASLPFSNIKSAWGPSSSSSCFCFMFYLRRLLWALCVPVLCVAERTVRVSKIPPTYVQWGLISGQCFSGQS